MSVLRPRNPALDDLHEAFATVGQQESPLATFLCANGHPLAHGYIRAREVFYSLTWTCGYGERLYLFADPINQVRLSAPMLTLGEPDGWMGYRGVDFSDRESWEPYAAAAAAHGFPTDTRPNGHLGRWTVLFGESAASAKLRAAFTAAGLEWRPVDGRADFRAFDALRFERIEAALRASGLTSWELAPYSPPAPAAKVRVPPPAAPPASVPAELSLFDMLA